MRTKLLPLKTPNKGEDDLQDPAAHHADLLCLCSMKVLRSQSLRMNTLQDESSLTKTSSEKDESDFMCPDSGLMTSGLYLCEVSANYGVSYGECRLNVTGETRSPGEPVKVKKVRSDHWDKVKTALGALNVGALIVAGLIVV
ncbi:hypothetical protein L3Q82_016645 [Scortum barcoo]|uniref:Uncharacterized protein n=1 Tax=Scortum barcoo TaxID=214431 RepID=A0ACB8X7V2_9TELE|nr:hypothetical protein L3Q82_016645 [Scortum barcoo]